MNGMNRITRTIDIMATQFDNYPQLGFISQTGNDSDNLDEFAQVFRSMGDSSSETAEYIETLSYYVMGIGGSIVCCLGTISNALSIAVLTRRSMRSSTYTYLTALAFCDSLVLFLTLLIIINDTRHPDIPKTVNRFHVILFPVVHPLAVVFQVTSIWLTLAFTVDRYIMICHPFRAGTMCRRSRARKVIICLYVAGLIFNIPRFLEYRTSLETVLISNTSETYTIYGINTTPLGNSLLFRELIHSWSYLVFICGTPFLTLVILNAFLIRAVHLSRLKGKEINPREKHRNDTTVMLIGVIVIFLICQGPALVSRMIYAFQPMTSDKVIITLNEVANFFVYLNSAVNIVPYYLFSRKFRSEFWSIFCSCCFDKDELRRINRSYSLSVDQRRQSQYNVIELNGVTPNIRNYVVCGDSCSSSQGGNTDSRNHLYNNQKRQLVTTSTTTCLFHSDTNGSTVVPLIHSSYHSQSSNRLGVRDSNSKDSLNNTDSQIALTSEALPSQKSHIKPGGCIKYMAVASAPCRGGSEWSAV